MKCLYLVVRSLDPKGTGQERWMNRWKPALNAFAITFEGRLFERPPNPQAGLSRPIRRVGKGTTCRT